MVKKDFIKNMGLKMNFIVRFGKKVGEFNSKALLVLVYFVGLGPSAVLAKLLRKSFLQVKPQLHKPTYWIDKESDDDFRRSF